MSEEPSCPPPDHSERADGWWKVLLIGGILYFVGLGVLALTGNSNLFPTVIILGSFLVPAAYVVFFYQRRRLSRLSMMSTGMAFFYGGVLGVFAAALLEPMFIQTLDFFTAFLVGLIEEAAKILGVLVIARHRRHNSELDGLILGAAAGMGFAALESTGYAFTAFLQSQGSLSLTVATVLVRAVLAPLGHGTWTAILAAVLFREGTVHRFHVGLKVIGAYLFVSTLHGLWNGVPVLFSAFLAPALDAAMGQLLVGAAGLYVLRILWIDALRRQRELIAAEAAPAVEPAAEEAAAGEATPDETHSERDRP